MGSKIFAVGIEKQDVRCTVQRIREMGFKVSGVTLSDYSFKSGE